MLSLNKKDESIEAIMQAIDFFENPEEKQVSAEEKEGLDTKMEQLSEEKLSFNRIQYQNLLALVLFMIGKDWGKTVEACEKGIKLCQDFKCEELMPEAEKQSKEFSIMKLRAMAKQRGMSALDLRLEINKQKEAENGDHSGKEAVAISKYGINTQTAAAYILSTVAVLGYFAYSKRSNY